MSTCIKNEEESVHRAVSFHLCAMDILNKTKREQCYSSLRMIKNRETGLQFLKQDTLASKYHKHVQRSCSYNEEHGAIFNLDFSPSGKVLVAACEKYAILLYDPTSKRRVHELPNAHKNCVNSICFCDERIFASGSDDNTIALWDTRKLTEAVTKFSGHTNWVKSIIYDKETGMLITSAFDGTVCIWDINKFSSGNCLRTRIYVETSLSRIQLTPSGDKLIISCRDVDGNHIMLIIHNLDLASLADDIFDKDVSYVTKYLMECENRKRNIPEKLDIHLEYPNIPFYIPSLAMHPHGSCLVSRCLTKNGLDQFTAVHDIQSFTYGTRRLSHYIQEPNAARGYIKEQGFSADGRVIASPFANGTRLLAFDPDCLEWRKDSDVKLLNEVRFLFGHSLPVCCSKFSPIQILLVTGCLAGKISFHEPKL